MSDTKLTAAVARVIGLNASIMGEQCMICVPPLRGYTKVFDPLNNDADAWKVLDYLHKFINTDGHEWENLWIAGDLKRALCETVAGLGE